MQIQLYELSPKCDLLLLARICYNKLDCTKPIHSLARFSGPTSITFNSPLRVAAITCPAPPTSLGVMHIQLYELSPKYNFLPLARIYYAKQDCTKPIYSLARFSGPTSITFNSTLRVGIIICCRSPNFVGGYAHSTLRVDF